jgi:membrane protein
VNEGSGWIRDGARKVVRVIPEAGQRFYSDRCPQQAAGIAYRVLFSVAPLAIVLVSIFGLVLQNEDYKNRVIDAIVDALPVSSQGHQDVENAISAIASPSSAAGLVSLVLFAWAATGMMTSIRQGLEAAMEVTKSRPSVRGKLVDLALVVGAAVLVLATAAVTVVGGFVEQAMGRVGAEGALARAVIHGVGFAITVGVMLLLYRFVPARGLRIRDGLAGAIVTGVLLQLISFASSFVYDKVTNLTVIYGSLTAALVFLYSVYLYSSALLLGAEVAAAWARPPSAEPGLPILTQIRRGVLGLFVKQPDPPAGDQPADPADRPSSER